MCNLSEGIREEAKEEAREEMIISMYKKGYSVEQIAEIVTKTTDEIEDIISRSGNFNNNTSNTEEMNFFTSNKV